ncbi:MAG TPA: hypothetical protein VG621_02010 [Candidatus Paceibacterota bacterium]|nr:hypothetical protein [Candidatus Paceibacterota bacterium]
MHKHHSTNIFALLIITVVGSLAALFVISKITISDDFQAIIQEPHTALSSSPNPITTFNTLVVQGWKVYRNEDMDIEFAYPDNWNLEEGTDTISLFFPSKDDFQKNLELDITYLKNKNIQNESVDQWEQENLGQEDILEKKKITLGNTPAIYSRYSELKAESLYDSKYYMNDISITLANQNNIFLFSGKKLLDAQDKRLTAVDITAAQQYQSDFEKVLASFHFLR